MAQRHARSATGHLKQKCSPDPETLARLPDEEELSIVSHAEIEQNFEETTGKTCSDKAAPFCSE